MRSADLALLNAERAARRAVVLVTELATGEQRVLTAAEVPDDPLGTEIAARILSGKSGLVERNGHSFFLTVHVPPVRLIVIGAVHISQALAPAARLAGLDVAIIDPRTAFAASERFPDARLLAEWPDDVLPGLALDRYTAVALVTHDPKIDDQALVAALRADCFYIGALGSRATHAKRLDRMRAHGFQDEDLARIRAPIGLDISAVSPAEIAISIVAEIIGAMRKKPARAEALG
ncbi:MAG: XdhC family protein [Beijerinckiaceae bacterium]|nr:XdhC family protein [Beijerinckiaceae bacterium]